MIEYKIPFDKNGNLMSFPERCLIVEWKDIFVFRDTLKYHKYAGGRSSMSMIFRSLTNNKLYPMFWKYFDEIIRLPGLGQGPCLTCDWTFIKKGMNYSIVPILGEEYIWAPQTS